ncbi:hypothetical protein D3C72_1803230 [compost metagenome]
MNPAGRAAEMPVEPAVHEDEMEKRGDIGGKKGREHGRRRGFFRSETDCHQHEQQDQHRADNIGGAESGNRPAIGARGAVQHIAQRHHRQGEQRQRHGNEIIGGDALAEEVQENETENRKRAGRKHGEDARRRGQSHDLVMGILQTVAG